MLENDQRTIFSWKPPTIPSPSPPRPRKYAADAEHTAVDATRCGFYRKPTATFCWGGVSPPKTRFHTPRL